MNAKRVRTTKWAAPVIAVALTLVLGTGASAATIEFFNQAAWTAAAGPGLDVVDFESFGLDAIVLGTEFPGLSIVQRDGLQMFATNTFFAPSFNVEGRLGLGSSFNQSMGFDDGRSDNIDFIFAGGASAAGLFIGNLGPGATTVEFLAPDLTTVIASEIFTDAHVGVIGNNPFNNRVWYGITTDLTIGAIRTVEPAGDGDLILYDSISWREAPEPATLALLGLGIAGLGFTRRRRN